MRSSQELSFKDSRYVPERASYLRFAFGEVNLLENLFLAEAAELVILIVDHIATLALSVVKG